MALKSPHIAHGIGHNPFTKRISFQKLVLRGRVLGPYIAMQSQLVLSKRFVNFREREKEPA